MTNGENNDGKGVVGLLDKALAVGGATGRASYEDGMARGLSADEIRSRAERRYRLTLVASGAAAGGCAGVPGLGTGVGIAAGVADFGVFLKATVTLIEVEAFTAGCALDDPRVRRMTVLACLVGESAWEKSIKPFIGRSATRWGTRAAARIPMEYVSAINAVLGRHFVTKFGTKQGVLVLGKALPFGIGSLIGAGSNLTFAEVLIRAAHKQFGVVPSDPEGGTRGASSELVPV